ncbi:hypothetical protein BDZ85DRAFT_273543 [Elsinoe ampelina]|uniref:NAD(P)-binding protein n=1 Tax=Elsinoe ampelina TaxID=302913 RepID=A0A6A6GGA5_9PEZI|nr:hypothetical protein BDZ85DRAFT_273543 [Elsinoe ampelina]
MGRTVLVSGAASGLGLEFLQRYSTESSSNQIYGIDINPLSKGDEAENITFLQVDITSESSLKDLTASLANKPIDLLIHSAGIRGLVPDPERQHHGDIAACETLGVMTPETMQKTFAVNSVGTFNLIKALLPNLRKSANSKVVVISSRMGSIGQNTSGSAYAYRASKAAQNSVVKSFSIDVPEVAFILCHPGRVETGLVQWKEEGAISVEESVSGLLPLIERWGESDSVKFYDRFGEPILW